MQSFSFSHGLNTPSFEITFSPGCLTPMNTLWSVTRIDSIPSFLATMKFSAIVDIASSSSCVNSLMISLDVYYDGKDKRVMCNVMSHLVCS